MVIGDCLCLQCLDKFINLCCNVADVLLRTTWNLVTSSSSVAPAQTVVEGGWTVQLCANLLKSLQTDLLIQALGFGDVGKESCFDAVVSAGSQLADRRDVT